MPLQMVNGTQLFVESVGEGEPLVLLHGSWAEHRAWGLVMPVLARSFQIIAYDRRGHGQSTADPLEGTVHDDVADLAALVGALDLGPVHLVGNSSGACIALRFAAAYPELVRKVAVHEPPFTSLLKDDPTTRPLHDEFLNAVRPVLSAIEDGRAAEAAELFVDRVAIGPGTWEILPEEIRGMFIMNALTFLGESCDPDMTHIDLETLGAVRAPVLATRGTTSPPMFAPILDVTCTWLLNVTLHTFDGAGHTPQATHPDAFAARTVEFLGPSGR